jgi:DNA-directed RNA polymerase subunit L
MFQKATKIRIRIQTTSQNTYFFKLAENDKTMRKKLVDILAKQKFILHVLVALKGMRLS